MKKKKTKTNERKLTAGELQKEILQLFKDHPKKRYNPRQIAQKLHLANNKDAILHALVKLSEMQVLVALEDFKFILKQGNGFNMKKKKLEGYVDVTRSGAAYIKLGDGEDDVYVSAKNLGSALHGDLVEIATWTPAGRHRPEGEVLRIIERATDQFIGTLWLRNKYAVVVPNRQDITVDITVDLEDILEADNGDRVVVKVVEWHKNQAQRPKGIVTSLLNGEGSDLEMKTILINNGFSLEFSMEALEEAESLPAAISPQELLHRRDYRKVTTFTIDPEDAKDFDDALSLQYLENGHYEVGVHIADVTHYIHPGSAIDQEAYHSSTSVYLVDRVLPMLPERLSNGLCSLRPHEDKLTFSAVFEFDKNGKVVNRWFGKTIIHSDRRFTYEEAQERIETGQGDFANELRALNRTAQKLHKERVKKGAIDFDTEEVRFRLDDNGVPLELFVKERKEAHMLIEDFMLLANREVATFIHKKGENQMEIPFIYRIHDHPNPEKIAELALFAKELGFQMHINTPREIAKSFNRLTELAEENPAFKLLQPIAIRTMAKAEYSTENIGHYGLAFDFYSHFTSPIRRYSDILAHRILLMNLEGRTTRVDKERLKEQCKHISAQERKAMDAERESIKYKQVEFIQKHIGKVFDGYISGMIDRGFFVELADSKAEGMVGFDSLNEPFDMADSRLRAKGMRSGKVIKMGDPVKVQIIGTDLDKRQIEMKMVEK